MALGLSGKGRSRGRERPAGGHSAVAAHLFPDCVLPAHGFPPKVRWLSVSVILVCTGSVRTLGLWAMGLWVALAGVRDLTRDPAGRPSLALPSPLVCWLRRALAGGQLQVWHLVPNQHLSAPPEDPATGPFLSHWPEGPPLGSQALGGRVGEGLRHLADGADAAARCLLSRSISATQFWPAWARVAWQGCLLVACGARPLCTPGVGGGARRLLWGWSFQRQRPTDSWAEVPLGHDWHRREALSCMFGDLQSMLMLPLLLPPALCGSPRETGAESCRWRTTTSCCGTCRRAPAGPW